MPPRITRHTRSGSAGNLSRASSDGNTTSDASTVPKRASQRVKRPSKRRKSAESAASDAAASKARRRGQLGAENSAGLPKRQPPKKRPRSSTNRPAKRVKIVIPGEDTGEDDADEDGDTAATGDATGDEDPSGRSVDNGEDEGGAKNDGDASGDDLPQPPPTYSLEDAKEQLKLLRAQKTGKQLADIRTSDALKDPTDDAPAGGDDEPVIIPSSSPPPEQIQIRIEWRATRKGNKVIDGFDQTSNTNLARTLRDLIDEWIPSKLDERTKLTVDDRSLISIRLSLTSSLTKQYVKRARLGDKWLTPELEDKLAEAVDEQWAAIPLKKKDASSSTRLFLELVYDYDSELLQKKPAHTPVAVDDSPLDTPSKSQRRSTPSSRRNDALTADAKERLEKLNSVGDFRKELTEKYVCDKPICLNYKGGHCLPFGEDARHHYDLQGHDFAAWAREISRGEATIQQPSKRLLLTVIKNEPVGTNQGGRRPAETRRRDAQEEARERREREEEDERRHRQDVARRRREREVAEEDMRRQEQEDRIAERKARLQERQDRRDERKQQMEDAADEKKRRAEEAATATTGAADTRAVQPANDSNLLPQGSAIYDLFTQWAQSQNAMASFPPLANRGFTPFQQLFAGGQLPFYPQPYLQQQQHLQQQQWLQQPQYPQQQQWPQNGGFQNGFQPPNPSILVNQHPSLLAVPTGATAGGPIQNNSQNGATNKDYNAAEALANMGSSSGENSG